jgi:hypothetical protein
LGERGKYGLEGKRVWRPRSTVRGTTTEKKISANAAPVATTHRHRRLPAGAAVAAAGPRPFITRAALPRAAVLTDRRR